jgi:molecular chaperone DnaJ
MEITIPAGIRHGDTVQYGNIPQQDAGFGKRILLVQFVITPHKDFLVAHHVHLIKRETVDALDAMVGTTLNIKTIDGATLAVTLPAGSKNGTKLKIPRKGLKYKDNPSFRGDMYVEIHISIPTLTDEEKKIITKLRDNRK